MMRNVSDSFHDLRQMVSTLLKLSADAWRFLVLCLSPSPALAAEVLFLRKQLALYEERFRQRFCQLTEADIVTGQ